jgi:hypothetical protein
MVTAVWGEEANGSDSIRALAYSIMFDTSTPVAPKATALIRLCAKEKEGIFKLQLHDASLGVLYISAFPFPYEKLEDVITAPHKETIFSSSMRLYHCNLSPEKERRFLAQPEGTVSFVAHYIVNGKYFSRFEYDMRAEWIKSKGWILEKAHLLPGFKQTRGIGGVINDMHSLCIVAPLDSGRALRIFAGWNDISGKVPFLGEIRITYKDIIDGIEEGDKKIREYFCLHNVSAASAARALPPN